MAPFMLLTLSSSLLVWARVYFYAVIGVALSMAFFASAAKPWLIKKLKERNKMEQGREAKEERVLGLGLPSDPAREVDEAIKEIREEVDRRRERGQSVSLPRGPEMKAAVEEKLGKKL